MKSLAEMDSGFETTYWDGAASRGAIRCVKCGSLDRFMRSSPCRGNTASLAPE